MAKSKSTSTPTNNQLTLWQAPGNPFEAIKHVDEQYQEYWLARELMTALEYDEWRNFLKAIKRAMIASENAGHVSAYHFVEANKLIATAKGAKRKIADYRLSRLGCYFTADNGDPSKPVVALAQNYFMIQTRRQEVSDEQKKLEQQKDINAYRLKGFDENRAASRVSSKATQKQLTSTAYATHVTHDPDFGAIGQVQNAGLFDMTKRQIVEYLGLLPKDENNYRDHLGHYALTALTEANKAAATRMKLAGRELTTDEQVEIVKNVVRILAPTMRELAVYVGQDYLSGGPLDANGKALIVRNVPLLTEGP